MMSCTKLQDLRAEYKEPTSFHPSISPRTSGREDCACAEREAGRNPKPFPGSGFGAGETTHAGGLERRGQVAPWRTSSASPTSTAAAWACSAATTRSPAASSASSALGSRCARSRLSPASSGWRPTGSSRSSSMILSAAIFITLIGLLGYLHFVKIDQETLLIIDSLGIQMTSSYASGKESTTFIEMGQVKDIVINEAIYMQKVIYYLCILLKDPMEPCGISQVVPVFQSAKPRLNCLIEVYRSCQEILANQKDTSTTS